MYADILLLIVIIVSITLEIIMMTYIKTTYLIIMLYKYLNSPENMLLRHNYVSQIITYLSHISLQIKSLHFKGHLV